MSTMRLPAFMSQARLRGQAEVIGAVLAVAALLVILLYMFSSIFATHQSTSYGMQLRRDFEVQRSLEALTAYQNNSETCIANNGTIPVRIVRLWLTSPNGSYYVRPEDLGYPGLELAPGETICLPLNASLEAIVTARGRVFTLQQLGLAPVQEAETAAVAQSIQARTALSNVGAIADLLNSSSLYVDPTLIEDPTPENLISNTSSGGIRPAIVRYDASEATYGFILDKEYNNTYITLSYNGQPARIAGVLIAHTPGSPDKYNIMVIGPAYDCQDSIQLALGKETIQLPCYNGTPESGWRIKIIGFTPTNFTFQYIYEVSTVFSGKTVTVINTTSHDISNVTGYWWFYGGTEKNELSIIGSSIITGYEIIAKLLLSGFADEVKVYRLVPGISTNYEPYLFVGDYDGNGLSEIVFSDEDTGFGGVPIDIGYLLTVCEANDDGLFMDYSNGSAPLLIYLTGERFRVDPSKYSMVEISTRVYFHDNEGAEDGSCVTVSDKPILGFYLVDPGPDGLPGTSDDTIVSSHELIYQQLDPEETTYPPNKNFVSISATLAVPEPQPSENKTYIIAVGFIDPYSGVRKDDVDFTLALESLNIVFYSRS